MTLSKNEEQALVRLLAFMWPRKWLQTEEAVWRCVIATRIILFLLAALLVIVLVWGL